MSISKERPLLRPLIEGLKQKTEEALSENLEDLRAEEAAVMSFIQAKLEKLEN